jgi:HTH-type transcriptional regulator, competence development regulator
MTALRLLEPIDPSKIEAALPPEPKPETFGSYVRDLRRHWKIPQRTLAATLGIDFTYLSKFENDRMPPPSDEIIEGLARELCADPHKLYRLAGRVAPSLQAAIVASPALLRLVRVAEMLSEDEREWLIRKAVKRQQKKGGKP